MNIKSLAEKIRNSTTKGPQRRNAVLAAVAVLLLVSLGCVDELPWATRTPDPTPSDYRKPPFSITILVDGDEISQQIPPGCNGCSRWYSNIAFRILSEGYFTLDIKDEGPIETTIELIPASVNTTLLQSHHFSFSGNYQSGILQGTITFDQSFDQQAWYCPQNLKGIAEILTTQYITGDSGGGSGVSSFQTSECLSKEPDVKNFQIIFDWTAVSK